MKERGARAARQAAEKSSSVTAAAAAARKGESGDFLGKRPLPTVSSKNRSAGTHAALSATVLG